jgi:peptidoglycan-N-acetylglucosamine deacetylase
VLAIWDAELRMAVREGRHVTYVMHPEIIGRGPQISALERFLDDISERHSVWFATHGEVARAVVGNEPVAQAAGT